MSLGLVSLNDAEGCRTGTASSWFCHASRKVGEADYGTAQACRAKAGSNASCCYTLELWLCLSCIACWTWNACQTIDEWFWEWFRQVCSEPWTVETCKRINRSSRSTYTVLMRFHLLTSWLRYSLISPNFSQKPVSHWYTKLYQCSKLWNMTWSVL